MKKLTFPAYRIVGEFTPDEQLGRYRYDLWIKVERDISKAIKENSEAYDECERKIFS